MTLGSYKASDREAKKLPKRYMKEEVGKKEVMKAHPNGKNGPKNISVFLRVRPSVSLEKGHAFNSISHDPTDNRVVNVIRNSGANKICKKFFFSRVFWHKSSQNEVYNAFAKNAVDAAFEGQHGVLFVYGQTGSGKTYTISNDDGNPENYGMLQRSLRDVWDRIAADKDHDYTCSVSYVQLYNEILTDLLDENQGRVRIQMGLEGCGDVVLVAESSGIPIEKSVTDYQSSMKMFKMGNSQREIASTSMNLTSSRSHTIFTFNINKATRAKPVAVKRDSNGDGSTISALLLEGRLVLCDLAGSERISKTHAEGKKLVEATHINGSLLVLGKVVHALTEKSQHAPFRESKLTRILQYSLLGNGKTSIIVNVGPSDDNVEESLSAINFGQRASQIKQDAKRHEVLDYKALYLQLMAELDAKDDKTLESALEEERTVYEYRISTLQEQVAAFTTENEALRRENTALRSGMSPEKMSAALASVGEKDWKTVIAKMRDMITIRDEKIHTIGDERVKLALLLSIEQRKCFKLAQKMQATMTQYKMGFNKLSARLDKVNAELVAAKGTDYLSLNNDIQEGLNITKDSHVDSNDLEGLCNDVNGNTERLNQLLRAYRAERVDLIVYQSKAQKAIRMLVVENEALRRECEANGVHKRV